MFTDTLGWTIAGGLLTAVVGMLVYIFRQQADQIESLRKDRHKYNNWFQALGIYFGFRFLDHSPWVVREKDEDND